MIQSRCQLWTWAPSPLGQTDRRKERNSAAVGWRWRERHWMRERKWSKETFFLQVRLNLQHKIFKHTVPINDSYYIHMLYIIWGKTSSHNTHTHTHTHSCFIHSPPPSPSMYVAHWTASKMPDLLSNCFNNNLTNYWNYYWNVTSFLFRGQEAVAKKCSWPSSPPARSSSIAVQMFPLQFERRFADGITGEFDIKPLSQP